MDRTTQGGASNLRIHDGEQRGPLIGRDLDQVYAGDARPSRSGEPSMLAVHLPPRCKDRQGGAAGRGATLVEMWTPASEFEAGRQIQVVARTRRCLRGALALPCPAPAVRTSAPAVAAAAELVHLVAAPAGT